MELIAPKKARVFKNIFKLFRQIEDYTLQILEHVQNEIFPRFSYSAALKLAPGQTQQNRNQFN